MDNNEYYLLLPPNATPLERFFVGIFAQLYLDIKIPITDLWRSDQCPSSLLPWLGWTFSADDNWNLVTTEEQKRALIENAVSLHQYKGTPWAMREAFKLCGYGDIKILEWFQSTPPKTPYTFQVEVRFYDRGPLSEDWDKALALIMRTKNMRSHLSALRVAVVVQHATPRLATATLSGETITVYPYQESTIRTEPARLSTRAAAHSAEIILIQPPAGTPL